MKIPQFDLTRQYEHIEPEIEAAIRGVLRSGRFILGPEGAAFEAECAAYLGVSHAIGLGSGSDAIKLILQAVGAGPDTEVITPAFSFVASATAALQLGARPVFVDIEPATLTLDPDRVAAAITPRTRAILAVHLYGLPAAMGSLRVLADAHGVHLLEDAAQAFGATLGGRHVGGHGQAAAFSFYPTKNLAAYGDAGLVTTTDPELAGHLRRARNHGETVKYSHAELGWTARLDELQAAILRVKLRHLPEWTRARQEIAARYTKGLAGLPIVLPPERPGATHVFHQYTLRTHQRDALMKHLADAGIGTACHYPLPIPAQPLFRELGYDAVPFPAAWSASREVLSLPCFPELRPDEIDTVVAAVRGFFEGDR
ncbi:MAG TPA: DegT/DnrJ/EryC1/StrS family aminotransferase [Methylomirabilota bacterium]|nr:DegT/DnrJ/EryC1/StrS family aminotransferase [Methylomirabilota bacterium]